MMAPSNPTVSGDMLYPDKGSWNRLFYKAPLFIFRMGLGGYLPSNMLLLSTWGRKSRQPRHNMLSFKQVGDKRYLISGWGEKSDWYKNVQANPAVTAQIGAETFQALAQRVTEDQEFSAVIGHFLETGFDSHFDSWLAALGIDPNIEDALAKKDRVYLVSLTPSDQPAPPPQEVDLKWIWPLMGVVYLAGWVAGRFSRRRRCG